MSFAEFIDMGGQGFYIWTCYAVTLVLFLGLVISVRTKYRNLESKLKRQIMSKQLQSTKSDQ